MQDSHTARAQRGSAIIMLFVAIALFGLVTYTLLQGSRNNTAMITAEAQKAVAYQSQDCSNAVSLATKRLTARGCGAMISAAADGSNTNPGAPSDGSCSLYHPKGGGVKADCAPPPAASDTCTTGPVGTVCTTDGAIYIGNMGGKRIYAAPTDESGTNVWSIVYDTTGADSTTDGLANTDNAHIVAQGASYYPAIWSCRNKAPAGTWYLPASGELNLLWSSSTNDSGPIDLGTINIDTTNWYYSSTETDSYDAHVFNYSTEYYGGSVYQNGGKMDNIKLRCFRRDP